MKYLFLTSILILILSVNTTAQCPPGSGISLNSQADVNNFVANYNTCTDFDGHLFIGNYAGLTDINDLSGLSFLQSVSELSILNTSLTDLMGLDNVSVSSVLFIFSNPSLADISSLSSISGSLDVIFIITNNNLASLQGLENITKVNVELTIGTNDYTSLDGLEGLTEVGGDLTISGSFTQNLLDMTALSNTTKVGGNVYFGAIETDDLGIQLDSIHGDFTIESSMLTGFGGLGNLEAVLGDFRLKSTSFPSFVGLGNLNYIGDTLEMKSFFPFSLDGLTSLDTIKGSFILNPEGGLNSTNLDFTGFEDLDYVGGLEIMNVEHNLSFTGLSNLTTIQNNLKIENSLIANGSALNGVTSKMTGNIEFTNMQGLNDISFLNNVSMIGGELIINNCGPLSQITGFNSLTETAGIQIDNNTVLNSISGFELSKNRGEALFSDNALLSDLNCMANVDSIFGSLTINNCDNLSDLTGLSNIKKVFSSIHITQNDNLQSLAGLDSVKAIVNTLQIEDNPILDEIASLVSIDFLNELIVQNNPSLAECCAINKLIPTVTTQYTIANNDLGCLTLADIKSSCVAFDPDYDGILSIDDNCPLDFNPNQEDYDGDGVGNPCDNCATIANTDQADANNNFIGDACEVAETGKVGINADMPASGLEIQSSDLFINDENRSIIMKNPLGHCYRLFINIDGELIVKLIDCPTE